MKRRGGTVSVLFQRLVRDRNGEALEAEYRVVANFTPGTPGKTYGPPEDCYPPEGPEVEYTEAFEVDGKSERKLDSKTFFDSLTEDEDSDLQDKLILEAEEQGTDQANEAADRKYDEWKDRQLDD